MSTRSSIIKHGSLFLFMLLPFVIRRYDLPMHIAGLTAIFVSFYRDMYILHFAVSPVNRMDFKDHTNFDKPTVIRKREHYLRII